MRTVPSILAGRRQVFVTLVIDGTDGKTLYQEDITDSLLEVQPRLNDMTEDQIEQDRAVNQFAEDHAESLLAKGRFPADKQNGKHLEIKVRK
jgi:hypothetical protein